MKKLTALLTALILALAVLYVPGMAAEEEAAPRVLVDGYYVDFGGHEPGLDDGAPIFPVKYVAEAMGLKYSPYPAEERAVVSDGLTSVELKAGQKEIRFSASMFVADRDISFSEGELCASGATVLRLARAFGFDGALNGTELTVDTDMTAAVTVNGNRLKLKNQPIERNGDIYLPVGELAVYLGLDYNLIIEEKVATFNRSGSGLYATVDFGELNAMNLSGVVMKNTEKILYEGGNLYLDTDSVIKLAEYFGFWSSAGKYGLGVRISTAPVAVKVNGLLTVFPDAQPVEDVIPLRFPIEAAGLKYEEENGAATVTSPEGNTVALEAGSTNMRVTFGGRTEDAALERAVALEGQRLAVSETALGIIVRMMGLEIESRQNGFANLIEITDPDAEPFVPQTPPKPLTVELDGVEISFPDVQPMVVDGRTLIPVRAVAEEMGMDVEWLDGAVSIRNGEDELVMTIGSAKLTGIRNGKAVEAELDVPARVIEERTCVPIRAIMEFFGAAVDWDGENQTVIITSAQGPSLRSVKEAESSEDFVLPLGFIIDAPAGSESIEYYIANGNTAMVRFSDGSQEYTFMASAAESSAVIKEADFVGPRMAMQTRVNGVPVTVYIRRTDLAQAARWTVGAYEFSLSSEGGYDIYEPALKAASTFVLLKEVEPAAETVDYSSTMRAVDASAAADLNDVGLVVSAPEEAVDVSYRILGGKIGEMSFSVNGHRYILRGAVNGGDLFDLDEEYRDGTETFSVSGLNGVGTANLRRTAQGSRIARWNWNNTVYIIYTGDESISDPEFRQVCGECASRSDEIR